MGSDQPSDGEACPTADLAAIDAVVGAQLEDFAAGDFVAALEHAAPGFRQQFTPERFEEVITDGFPIVATYRSYALGTCTREGQRASVVVEVVGDDGVQTLGYGVELVDGEWRIVGAVPLSEVEARGA